MNVSLTMEFVLLRAVQEAAAFSGGKVGTEHLFLGLLKLPEMNGKDVLKDESRFAEFDAEAAEVAAIVGEKGWDASALRSRLRACLQQEKLPANAEEQMQYVLGSAAYHAQKDRGSESVSAADVLKAILRHPTLMLSVLLKGEAPAPAAASEMAAPVPEEPKGLAFLPKLTADVRALRYALLSRICGQDQAVHAVTEGIFSAELLAAADPARKGPRAVFVFVGPPGVGKTFLAETAAGALRLPFKRLDMSSYADHQAHVNLIGFAPSFKDAKPGQLTGFVKKHPRCVLLLDELEKAHGNVIRLLLQVLDGGRLHDDYLDEDVDFRDTLIILTTNAGRQLWEGAGTTDPAGLPRQSVLSALQTDIDPATKQPYFPAAICSRLSAGYVMLFNRLSAHDLGHICEAELERFCSLFETRYGIRVTFDRLLPMALLFSEGAGTDARALCSRVQRFCRNEVYRLCSLWSEDHVEKALAGLRSLHFSLSTEELPEAVRELFVNPRRPELLVLGEPALSAALQTNLPDFDILAAATPEEACDLAERHEPLLVLMDLQPGAPQEELPDDPFDDADWAEAVTARLLLGETELPAAAFDNLPLTAGSIRAQTAFLMDARERGLDLPVWLLETPEFRIDDELMGALSRLGVRGKLLRTGSGDSVLSEQLQALADQAYLQQTAAALGAEQRVLTFDTEPTLSQDSHTALIHLRSLRIRRAAEAEDVGDLLEGAERPDLCFEDVIGAAEAKEELRFFAEYLSHPKRFLARGLHPPKGILLYGPPGTGKTLLARAMAGEAKVAFIAEEATNFVTKYQGSGPEAIRRLFRKARRYAPAVIFIDEIDAIGRSRGSGQTGHGEEMTLNALLTEMDGFRTDPRRPIFVLAATNFAVDAAAPGAPGSIDPALARRFDRKILVDLPDREDRLTYLRRLLASSAVSEQAVERLAGRSAGMSLAELSSVLEQGNRAAVRGQRSLTDADLEEAFERIRHGSEKHWGESYMERVAYHESGHALLCHLNGRTPAYLTIVARGSHGGYMEHADTEDTPLRTRQELLGRIRTALGGRAAELVRFGPEEGLSTGASGDLSQATELASALLLRYGMDEKFGQAAFERRELLAGPLADRYAERLNAILTDELAQAADLLCAHRHALDRLAEALLARNKLTGEEIAALIDG